MDAAGTLLAMIIFAIGIWVFPFYIGLETVYDLIGEECIAIVQ